MKCAVHVVAVCLLSGVHYGFCQAATPHSNDQPQEPKISVNFHAPAPHPTPTLSDLERFRRSRQPDQLLSTTIDDDHEDAGLENGGGGKYSGAYAVHTVYSDLQLKLPQNAVRTQTLFAPTTRPPNGACLELGTAYTTDINTGSTGAALYVYDFCKPGGPDWGISPTAVGNDSKPKYPIDANFIKTYAGDSIQTNPAYRVTIYTADVPPASSSKWVAQLYNFHTSQWETLYTSTGVYNSDVRGWTIFETWFQSGQCSESLPLLGANAVSYFNYSTQKWEPLAQHMHGLDNYTSHGGSHNQNCFTDDHTGPASYTISPDPPQDWWKVVSR
jgi:hypothetical protein